MLLPAILLALAPAPSQAATPPTPTREKMICRKQNTTGSRLASEKICMTKAQWEERTRNDQKVYNDMLKVACGEGSSSPC